MVTITGPCRELAAGTLLWALAIEGRGAAVERGREVYDTRCAACHGGDGNGGERGLAIAGRLPMRTDEEITAVVRAGLPGAGMPGFPVDDSEMEILVAFLRSLRSGSDRIVATRQVGTVDGRSLEGQVLGETASELQLLSRAAGGHRLHLLRKADGVYREVTSQTDWPGYNGDVGGNRYSPTEQLRTGNVARLVPRWIFPVRGAPTLEVTPVVVDGVMYVTGPNMCFSLDAGSGRLLWSYQRPRTRGLVGDTAAGINRGVAVARERVLMVTDHAHLIALDRFTGALLWETEMADYRENYGATSAPLVVRLPGGGEPRDLVISGISGGDEGVRGFVAAYDPETGREVWRFWTVPRPGEPGSETWQGKDIEHPCASTWLTGTYDPERGLVYWPTGNPCPDHNGDEREGDNLYSDSILALDARSGALRWHYQYTPHDLWDWDAQQPPVLADLEWRGRTRSLLLHANRNGFFYVLDRITGERLLSRPFVKKLTWAKEIDARGRPVLNANQKPTPDGTTVCPAVEGATNWYSTSFHPGTGLYYVQTLEKCSVYKKADEGWKAGRSYYGGSTSRVPDEVPQKVLRAIDVRDGAVAWERPQSGDAESWGGVLSTAGGLVFVADDSGAFTALDARTGAPLWEFLANARWRASPMTYVFDRRQYVAIAAGSAILAFALPD